MRRCGTISRRRRDFGDDLDAKISSQRSFASLPHKQPSGQAPPLQDPGLQSSCQKVSSTEVSKLLKFPPEIQAMIYRAYFTSISDREPNVPPQTPNLLAAVRCQPDTYRKVLEVYRQEYNFLLRAENELNFQNNVSMDLVRSIRHLTITSARCYDPYELQNPSLAEFQDYVWHRRCYAKIHQATQLRSVIIHLEPKSNWSETLLIADLMFNFFPLLMTLSIHVVQVYTFGVENVPSLQEEVELFKGQVELTSMATYEKVSEGEKQAVGFECQWLGKDGNRRRLAVEKTLENERQPTFNRF